MRKMHLNILTKKCLMGRKKLIFFILCIGSLFVYNQIFKNEKGEEIRHKEVLNIRELMDSELSGFKINEGKNRKSIFGESRFVENCEMKIDCPVNSFPVHLYTGKANNDVPKLCVGGYYVFEKGRNEPGRGLNLALIDSNTSTVFQVRHYDTYESDPTQLEMFLEKYLEVGDILVIFTHDEASNKFSGLAENILQNLGSGLIQNLKFRSTWYMITQKGIKGFTPFEKLSLAENNKKWGDIFNESFCVPIQIQGRTIHPDEIALEHKKRRNFCDKTSGYGEFCSDFTDTNLLFPLKVDDESLLNHPVFSVPIVILAGTSLYSLPLTLETVVRQPGINLKMVTVFYLPALSEASKIADLFKVKSAPIGSSHLFEDQVAFAFNHTVESYPNASHLIFLEEDLILSPDFLSYMAQMMPLLEMDPTLYSVSAFNENGYKGTSSNSGVAYRVSGFPGLAFMISKTTYIRQMRGHMKQCCSQRAWMGWKLFEGSEEEVEMVVPDVSRVWHRPYEGLGPDADVLEELFNRDRVTSQRGSRSMENVSQVISSEYEKRMEELLHTAILLDMSRAQLEACARNKHTSATYFTFKNKHRQAYVLYHLSGGDDVIKKLCGCFGLFHHPQAPPRGLHRGLLRFSIEGHDVMLVGSHSPYFRFKPSYHPPLD